MFLCDLLPWLIRDQSAQLIEEQVAKSWLGWNIEAAGHKASFSHDGCKPLALAYTHLGSNILLSSFHPKVLLRNLSVKG